MASSGTDLLDAFRTAVRAKIQRDLDAEAERARTLRAEVLPRVEEATASARLQELCSRVWLFGSYAWGQPSERSDVDLLVEACSDPFRFAGLVATACGRDVHAIELERAPEGLRQRVLAEGTLL